MASNVSVNLSDLTCFICLEIFKDARGLQCFHSFRFTCLEEWVKKSVSSDTITYPLCKETSAIPPGGLTEIKSNFFISGLTDRLGNIGSMGNPDSLASDNLDDTFCKAHPKNTVDQYCSDCNLAACATCLLQSHRYHNLVGLSEQIQINTDKLQHIVKEKDVMIKLIDLQMVDREKHNKKSKADIHQIKQQINKLVNDRINKLKEQRDQLVKSLDTMVLKKEEAVTKIRERKEYNKAALGSLRSHTDDVMIRGKMEPVKSIEQIRNIESELQVINMTGTPAFVWSRQDSKSKSSKGTTPLANIILSFLLLMD